MRIVYDTRDLDANKKQYGIKCYCDYLLYATDLILQIPVVSLRSSPYTLKVNVVTPGADTVLEDATSYFQGYVFDANGSKYLNLQLQTFTALMCSRGCFALQILLSQTDSDGNQVFPVIAYTDSYCPIVCCSSPMGMSVTETGNIRPVQSEQRSANIPITECGDPLIRIRADYECDDRVTGEYYPMVPTELISDKFGFGGAPYFRFTKITTLTGFLQRIPDAVTVQTSYNCRTQRIETTPRYDLHSEDLNGLLPDWKVIEMIRILSANTVYVGDTSLDQQRERLIKWDGNEGSFKLSSECAYRWKMEAVVTGCTVRQTFGCEKTCSGSKTLFFGARMAQGKDTYYDESRQPIGTAPTAVQSFFTKRDNVKSVQDVTAQYPEYATAFIVTYSGIVPTSFYAGEATPQARVYGNPKPYRLATSTPTPVAGSVTFQDVITAKPVYGGVAFSEQPDQSYALLKAPNWNMSSAKAVKSGSYARLSFSVKNPKILMDAGQIVQFVSEFVAALPASVRPEQYQSIQYSNYRIDIDTNGSVYYTGPGTTTDTTGTTITITNAIFSL